MEKLKSRRFWLSVTSILIGIFGERIGLTSETLRVVLPLCTTLGFQMSDALIDRARIAAKAVVDCEEIRQDFARHSPLPKQ